MMVRKQSPSQAEGGRRRFQDWRSA